MSQKTMPPEVQAAMIQVAGRWAALNIQNKYPEPLYGERLFTELGESFEWALTVLAQEGNHCDYTLDKAYPLPRHSQKVRK